MVDVVDVPLWTPTKWKQMEEDVAAAQTDIDTLQTNSVIILKQSSVAVPHTGDTNEFTFATVPVAAGLIGPNDRIEVSALFTYTNSANTKNLKLKFGGLQFRNLAVTTSATIELLTFIANRNSLTSQIGPVNGVVNVGAASASSPITQAVNTAIANDITLTGTLTLGTETVTLESYLVRLIKVT